MKKVIRLNENDIEKLVRKIISEEKKTVNEGIFDWVRSKRFSDEELGQSILKGIQKGEISRIDIGDNRKDKAYDLELAGHRINVIKNFELSPGGGGTHYYLIVDNEPLNVSNGTIKKILNMCDDIVINKPRESKVKNLKTSLNRYNLPDEERTKIEDTDNIFKQLHNEKGN